MLRVFVTYMVILQQLNTGNVCRISKTDISQEFNFYIDNINDPDIQAVFRQATNFVYDRDFLMEGSDP